MGGLCSKPPPSATAAPNVVSVVDLTSNAPSSAAATEEESVVSPLKLSFSPGAGIAEEMTAEESVAARLEVRRDRRVSDIRTRSLSLPLASEEILLEELPPAKAATAPPKDDDDDAAELVRTTTLKASFSSFRVRAVSILSAGGRSRGASDAQLTFVHCGFEPHTIAPNTAHGMCGTYDRGGTPLERPA